jgi:hypothetical protein
MGCSQSYTPEHKPPSRSAIQRFVKDKVEAIKWQRTAKSSIDTMVATLQTFNEISAEHELTVKQVDDLMQGMQTLLAETNPELNCKTSQPSLTPVETASSLDNTPT